MTNDRVCLDGFAPTNSRYWSESDIRRIAIECSIDLTGCSISSFEASEPLSAADVASMLRSLVRVP